MVSIGGIVSLGGGSDGSGGDGVDNIGVIGGADLTGGIDLSSHPSGFLVITDNAGSSPINFGVDTSGLSGLWDFPSQGFNGSVVNSINDKDADVNIVGASGIVIKNDGQDITVSADGITSFLGLATCYSATFSAGSLVNVNHNLGTEDIVLFVWDNNTPRRAITPDDVILTDSDNIDLRFASAQAGRIVVLGCQ